MEGLEQIKARIEAAVPGAKIEILQNASPSQQHSLKIDNQHAGDVAKFLRDDPALRFDFCSNVTGVDWLDRTVKKTVKVKKWIDGEEKEVTETTEEHFPGYLYGIRFEGHPDLLRILMWDEFVDHPMRRDYREPDDYEYEPTPHDDVLERAKQHYPARPQLDGAEEITATDLHG